MALVGGKRPSYIYSEPGTGYTPTMLLSVIISQDVTIWLLDPLLTLGGAVSQCLIVRSAALLLADSRMTGIRSVWLVQWCLGDMDSRG